MQQWCVLRLRLQLTDRLTDSMHPQDGTTKVLSAPVTGSLLQMNSPSNGPPTTGGGTLLFGGSELTVVLTFQLPALTVQLAPFPNSFAFSQLLSVSSAFLNIGLSAYFTGGNSGNVTASFSYTNFSSGIVTQIAPPTLMVSMPMLVGGWVSAAISVSSTGVTTLSVRDIFTTNNATGGA